MVRKKLTGTTKPIKKLNFWSRHKGIKKAVIILLILFFGIVSISIFDRARDLWHQVRLEPFYQTNDIETNGTMGQIVRQEPLGRSIKGGEGYRVLYQTQRSDGSLTFSSGMIFIPDGPAPPEGRPILAWAHGTVGMGNQCAPSRSNDELAALPWITEALQQGWIVTATDYAGLGTPGTPEYLVGRAEAHDVLNSVRAAQVMQNSHANNRFAIWGHSQGGHSALFAGALAQDYTPELELVGTVAAAPAAELAALFTQQESTAASWVIGPEVMVAWPSANSSLNVDDVLTATGKRTYQGMAEKCIKDAAIEGMNRQNLGQRFFSTNIMNVPSWAAEVTEQTAPILSPTQPVLVIESTTDNVVLPNTTALYIQRACQANSNLTSLWLAGISHMDIAADAAPQTIAWLNERFNNRPASSNCGELSPVQPYTP